MTTFVTSFVKKCFTVAKILLLNGNKKPLKALKYKVISGFSNMEQTGVEPYKKPIF